jgi:hypothetical protein
MEIDGLSAEEEELPMPPLKPLPPRRDPPPAPLPPQLAPPPRPQLGAILGDLMRIESSLDSTDNGCVSHARALQWRELLGQVRARLEVFRTE